MTTPEDARQHAAVVREAACGGSAYNARMEAAAAALDAMASEVERLRAADMHSCGPGCTRSSCVNDRLRAELEWLRAQVARPREVVDGDYLWLWKNGNDFLAFRHEYPCFSAGGDPMTLGQPFGRAEFRSSHDRATSPGAPAQMAPALTDAMLSAGKKALHNSNGRGALEKVERIYAAMVAVSRAQQEPTHD